jgi:DNA-binding CsgD family transcriptional regulator
VAGVAQSSDRRAALSYLLAQPSDRERRPCRACIEPCRCERRSTACGCGCGPGCPHVATALSQSCDRVPVLPGYVPILYALSALRVFQVLWPKQTHYCGPSGEAPPRPIYFRTAALEYASLISHRLRYLDDTGALSTRWRVFVVADLSGEASFALEPVEGGRPASGLWSDLAHIGSTLTASVRRIASARLRLLRHDEQLTRREREVLDLFLLGLCTDTISARLFISPHTVRNHLKRLFAKFDVSSQKELRERFLGLHA